MKERMKAFVNKSGVKFNVRLVLKGEFYGLNDKLKHMENEPLVEFYDARYDHTDRGQFVSRYYLSTIIERDSDYDLDLYGGSWYIDRNTMKEIVEWLGEQEKHRPFPK